MTLESVMKRAEASNKKVYGKAKAGFPVRITKNKNKNAKQITINIYEEPNGYDFSTTNFWLPVAFPENKCIYLIYSTKEKGYKVQRGGQGDIGHIAFVNEAIYRLVDEHTKEKNAYFKWKWDSECALPYIEFN